jgi:hypothetical protein
MPDRSVCQTRSVTDNEQIDVQRCLWRGVLRSINSYALYIVKGAVRMAGISFDMTGVAEVKPWDAIYVEAVIVGFLIW